MVYEFHYYNATYGQSVVVVGVVDIFIVKIVISMQICR